MTHAVSVPFAGVHLLAVMQGNAAFVAMRPIVEGMGLDWSKQLKKLKAHPVLARQLCTLRPDASGATFSTVGHRATVGSADGKAREMVCLPVSRLSFWLATVNPQRVKPILQERVILFQEQCADVLHAALSDQSQDRIQAIADKRAAARLLTDILQEVRAEQGKATAPHHFSNEHRLCNAALTGRFAAVDEAGLSAKEAQLLARIRRRDALLIARGVDYPKRKTALMDFARAIVCTSLPAATQCAVTRKKPRPHDCEQIGPGLTTAEKQPKETV